MTFVLLHGAWMGGWCRRDVARLLRRAGHEVYAPTCHAPMIDAPSLLAQEVLAITAG